MGSRGKSRLARLLSDKKGQATVELVVTLPVAILVAVIVVNALTFFGMCTTFDQVVRQSVCTYGTAPGPGESASMVAMRVREAAEAALDSPNVTVSVEPEGAFPGLTRYRGHLSYRPTLFGLSLRSKVFGISLPALSHEVDMVVDAYRPGILF